MDEVKLNSFLTVCRCGSFTKAADELFLSPIAIKKQIDGLEADLGEALFIRKTTGCTLTPVGEVFLTHAQKILTSIQTARNAVESRSIMARGEIIAGHSITFNYRFVGSLSTGFSETHNNCLIQFQKYPSRDLIDLLEHHKINCIFAESTLLTESRPEIEFHPLISLPIYAIMAKNHSLAGLQSLCISDLLNQEIYVSRAVGEESLNQLREIAGALNYIEETDRNVLFKCIIKGAVEIYPRQFSYYHCIPLEDRHITIGIFTLKPYSDVIRNMIHYARNFVDQNEEYSREIM